MTSREHITEVGRRYAQALYDLAVTDTATLAAVEADLTALQGLITDSADLSAMLASPLISAAQKGAALAAICQKAGTHDLVQRFVGVLAQNGRAADLHDAIAAFLALSAERAGVVTADVTSAHPIKPAQMTALQDALTAALGAPPVLTTQVDPDILGGLKVQVGSRMLDASLKTKLELLTLAMKRA